MNLLAEQDWIKVVGAVGFVLFWVISALAGNMAKKKEQEELRRRGAERAREPSADSSGRPVLPPSLPEYAPLPNGGRVATREELERRIAQARTRREPAATQSSKSSTRGTPVPRDLQSSQSASRDTPAPRDLQSARSGDQSAPTGPRPRDVESTRTGKVESVMTSRSGDQGFRSDGTADSTNPSEIRREQKRAEVELARQRGEQVRADSERKRDKERRRLEKQSRQRQSPPVQSPQRPSTAAVLAPKRFMEEQTVVRRTVATDKFEFSTDSPTANQRPQVADAATIRRWLTPATLKQQYILTELLSPPMALRPPREF